MNVAATQPVRVVRDLEQAGILLEPTRLRLMRQLAEPNSATGLAKITGMPRQRINYHLRALENAGLVRLVEERRKRNCTERIVQATATAYLISPEALAELGPQPDRIRDRFSWSYLVAIAARALRELAILRDRADRAKQKLATITLDANVRFASADAMNAFAEEVSNTVAKLAAKYHDDKARGGRLFRFFAAAYPAITRPDESSENPPDELPNDNLNQGAKHGDRHD